MKHKNTKKSNQERHDWIFFYLLGWMVSYLSFKKRSVIKDKALFHLHGER